MFKELNTLMAYCTIALFFMGFVSLALGLFNTAMMTFSFAIIALGFHKLSSIL